MGGMSYIILVLLIFQPSIVFLVKKSFNRVDAILPGTNLGHNPNSKSREIHVVMTTFVMNLFYPMLETLKS